jgi:hypothetical protein
MGRVTEMFWFRLIMLFTWTPILLYLVYKINQALSSKLLSFANQFVG